MRRIGVTFAVALLALAAAGPATPHLLKRQGGEAEHVYHQRLAHHGTTAVRWVERHRHLYRTTSASEARASPYARAIRNHRWLARTFLAKVAAWRYTELRRTIRQPFGVYKVAMAEALRLGVTPAEWHGCLAPLISRENANPPETWNPGEWNHLGSGAYGLGQALPGDKMRRFGRDWKWNPATQARWLVSYVERYGGPCAADAFQRAHSWY